MIGGSEKALRWDDCDCAVGPEAEAEADVVDGDDDRSIWPATAHPPIRDSAIL